MPLTAKEIETARKVLDNLRSEKYKGKNEVFLYPFDISQVPGYLETIGAPLDLKTVADRIESHYHSLDDVWNDTAMIFENAVRYHANRKETKWIAKLAKEMLKKFNSEKARALDDGTKKSQPKLKLKLPTATNASANVEPTAVPSAETTAADNNNTNSNTSGKSADKLPVKAKNTQPKIKLKLSIKKNAEITPAPPSNSNNSTKPKLPLKVGDRGKELPQSVTTKPPKSSSKKKTPLTPARRRQCHKVILGLRRRHYKDINWFLQPVSDKTILKDYKAKIKHPMDISTLTAKLEKGSYGSLKDFVLDVRRIFSNALTYNTSIKDSIRSMTVSMLETSEELCQAFITQTEPTQPYPLLLYCWKLCVGVLDTLYNLTNPSDGAPTALYFLHPVPLYCGGQYPPEYLQKVTKPMDFATVTTNLLEGRYQKVEEFLSDCKLIVSNCLAYYSDRPDGAVFAEQASRLGESLAQQAEQLMRYDKSSKGEADRAKAAALVQLPKPPPAIFLSVLRELRGVNYTDKATKITEPAMRYFEKPVSTQVFPDYSQHVSEPIDLGAIEKKAASGTYLTPEDFEYDMNLMFRNCEVYNSQRPGGEPSVTMAKYGARKFRQIFYTRMKEWEEPNAASPPEKGPGASILSTSIPSSSSMPPPKKIKLDLNSGNSKGKTAPRISINAAQVISASTVRPTSPKTAQPSTQKGDQPIPLHIAIARVKEAFPMRRAVKSLQSWEADCARFFKELLRHPWLSAARPKFIFHVPVPDLFPELREAYAAKVRKPMDLTTIECQLLAGNRYAGPDDFVQDVSLVFANAVRFNKDGRDVGDPLSCAYYDASVHLLRYSRWLSMELLTDHLDDTDHMDEAGADGLPPFVWKLTKGNRKKAREEMEALVLREPIDRSLEGDRWTWHEAECEKLLKSLRHQSDLRYMTFFLQPNYPPDYAAFISKPMDWEKVQRTLRKRQYDKFADVIDDLRLIFSNALKYNSSHRGTDTISGKAYAAAEYMSAKLEAAYSKMLLTVSDRLERERIDHNNAEREIEAADRAEEARIREAWKKQPGKDTSSPTTIPTTDLSEKLRFGKRSSQKRETADLEIPYFDEEDDGQHERSYFEYVKFQKSMFESQRQELFKMRQIASAISGGVYVRYLQCGLARQWLEQQESAVQNKDTAVPLMPKSDEMDSERSSAEVSSVLEVLQKANRSPLQIRLTKSKMRAKSKQQVRPLFSFE